MPRPTGARTNSSPCCRTSWRNPLAPRSKNAVTLLRQADDEPRIRADAQAILERQVSHMIRLVEDLLDIARLSRWHPDMLRAALERDRDLAAVL
ncbi:MAG: hypothetical protein ACT4P4_09610 [Betaproteobacteria bacterium]